MACLTTYTIQCADVDSGKTGCFLYDQKHWQLTGEFKAIGPVYPDLIPFFKNTPKEKIQGIYLERIAK